MKRFLVSVGVLAVLAGAVAVAETVTLPAASSIVGAVPFFSDVRVFNTSYTTSLDVTATYHCFIPSPCTAGTSPLTMTLAPRESRGFDDIVQTSFAAPNTAGGIEFDFSGSEDQLVVTSRLYSTEPEPTVGMFIPGVVDSDAFTTTMLTSIRNAGTGAGFRTNVGVYNREGSAASVTFTIFDGGRNQVGNPVTVNVAAHSGAQVNRIFDAAGAPLFATNNAAVVVSSTGPVFSYAAVIDNNTSDPIFVIGAKDQPQQPITPVATNTPAVPSATRTPTRPPNTPTPTPITGATRTVNVGEGGTKYVDEVSGNSTTNITVGTTVRWVWVGSGHNVDSGACPPCVFDGRFISGALTGPPSTFSFTFTSAGTFPYFCDAHTVQMTGVVNVTP